MPEERKAVDTSEGAVLARLKELVRQVLDEEGVQKVDLESLTPATPLLSLPLDSMTTLQLMSGVEESYTVYIPEEKAFEFQTIGDLIGYIQEKTAARAARAAARQGE
jgi:acyl carrier protein